MPYSKCALQLQTICRAGTKRFRDKPTSNGSYWQPTPKSTAFVIGRDSKFVCRPCYEADLIERKKRVAEQSNHKLNEQRQAARQASIIAATQPNNLAAALPAVHAVNFEH